MKVLLWKDHEKLGKRGDVVNVATGYARNYLFPRRLASPPTPENQKGLALEHRRQKKIEAKRLVDFKALADRIEKAACTVEAHANEEGGLYGALGPGHVVKALAQEGIEIEEKSVELTTPVKELGVYTVPIRLGAEVTAELKLWVVLAGETPKVKKE